MWEFVNFVACYGELIYQTTGNEHADGCTGYTKMEVNVIKVRVAAGDAGELSEEEIASRLDACVAEMVKFLSVIESLMAPSGFVFGTELTWGDYYLYPLMADLEATPESRVITPRMKGWIGIMKERPEVGRTSEGTLAAGGRPPAD
jgi:glutathione S-transferase